MKTVVKDTAVISAAVAGEITENGLAILGLGLRKVINMSIARKRKAVPWYLASTRTVEDLPACRARQRKAYRTSTEWWEPGHEAEVQAKAGLRWFDQMQTRAKEENHTFYSFHDRLVVIYDRFGNKPKGAPLTDNSTYHIRTTDGWKTAFTTNHAAERRCAQLTADSERKALNAWLKDRKIFNH